MQTRSASRNMKKARLRTYRKRVKLSHCRGQTRCRIRNGCKRTASGKIRSYCRKSKNRRI